MSAFQGYAKPGIRENFTDNTFEFDKIFLGQDGTFSIKAV
jgi:hypothetical protein